MQKRFLFHNLWKTLVEKWKTYFFENFVQSDEIDFFTIFLIIYIPSSEAEALSEVSAKIPF